MLLSQLKINEGQARQIRKEDLPIEQEIECPRCLDIMTLPSEFDMLGYYCEECSFSLYESLKVSYELMFEAVTEGVASRMLLQKVR
jgi:hypothetical protein